MRRGRVTCVAYMAQSERAVLPVRQSQNRTQPAASAHPAQNSSSSHESLLMSAEGPVMAPDSVRHFAVAPEYPSSFPFDGCSARLMFPQGEGGAAGGRGGS